MITQHPNLLYLLIAYLTFGLFVTVVAVSDILDDRQSDSTIRWWHVVRGLLLCLFVSQFIFVGMAIADIWTWGVNKLKIKFKRGTGNA